MISNSNHLRSSNMKNKLVEIIQEIDIAILPVRSKPFAGAGLIITSDPDRSRREQDLIVHSEDAASLSWFVFRLKDAYGEMVNCTNKREFYENLGTQLNKAKSLGLGTKDQMKYVLHFFAAAEGFSLNSAMLAN